MIFTSIIAAVDVADYVDEYDVAPAAHSLLDSEIRFCRIN